MNIIQQVVAASMYRLVQEENLLLIKAVAISLGLDESKVNPFDYVNRMARNVREDGAIFFLDGNPILWVGRPQSSPVGCLTPSFHGEYEVTVAYKFLSIKAPEGY